MVTASPAASGFSSTQLIVQLGDLCRDRGLPDLARRLVDLHDWIRDDLRQLEADLALLARGPSAVQRAAYHLFDLGGKHLRPMCVVLAAKAGNGFGPASRQLAVAVELVHTATLLHDDVVDLGTRRRGAPSPPTIYGNAASVFAGDWLLIQALKRVRSAAVPGVLDRLLDTIDEMILAESVQLEQRGTLAANLGDYFRVVEGKTAALFRWAMYAGGRASGLDAHRCAALEQYGLHLGIAFQAVDDCLDFSGDAQTTGKVLLADLREGKTTYPLAVAIERDPDLQRLLHRCLGHASVALPDAVVERVAASVRKTGAIEAGRALACEHVARAVASLAPLADGGAKDALVTVAEATAYRER